MRSVQSPDCLRIEQANSDFMSRVSSRVRSTDRDQNYVHNAVHQSKFKDPTSLINAMYRRTEVCVSEVKLSGREAGNLPHTAMREQ